MRTIILAILFIPFVALAQKGQIVYLKLTDASGQQIKGDAMTKGYERSIEVLSFASAGKNNSQLSFSMNITGASADLKKTLGNGTLLPAGTLSVLQPGGTGGPIVMYTIKMENIRVSNCAESMGCNGAITTTSVIAAGRIGWTYYQTDAMGRQTVSRKYGFDSDSGKEWTNF